MYVEASQAKPSYSNDGNTESSCLNSGYTSIYEEVFIYLSQNVMVKCVLCYCDSFRVGLILCFAS